MNPELKRSVKSAIRSIATNPRSGTPLRRELEGLWKYRVRRFRIVYAIDTKARIVRVLAVGHRIRIYEEIAAQLKGK
jgi:mRNA interferase RelE/StbE